MPRSSEILLLAAKELENGSDPFARSFLVEHKITLDELSGLADQLALGARLILHLKEQIKKGGLSATDAVNHLAEITRDG